MYWTLPHGMGCTLISRSTNPASCVPVRCWPARPAPGLLSTVSCCNQIAVGFPPKPYALSAYLALLEEEAPGAPWMIAGVGADIRPLIGETVRRGGHVRVGLEDAPLGTKAGNLAIVEEAVRMVRDHGGEPASPGEMRQALAASA
jgi:3-keto-5-aminohexanoate cleavage enzyme